MLKAHNLSSWYRERQVLKNINFSLQPGELLAVIGPNGSGKSTLLRTAAGLHSHWDGVLELNGVSMREMPPKEIARHIAWLPQFRPVPDITVWRMVLHGRFPYMGYPRYIRESDCQIVAQALEDADAISLSERFLRDLSGGERQKVFFAMALAQNCGIILMDEPIAWLDALHQFQTITLAKRLTKEGKSVMMVLHDLPMAFSFADRIVLMQDGKIVCAGTAESLFAQEIVSTVFGVGLRRILDNTIWRYYYAETVDIIENGKLFQLPVDL